VAINIRVSTKPNFTRPKLLLHPPIPSQLRGVNPRTIKGQEWWDVVRRQAYGKNNYCCWACGMYCLDTPGPLEAHECYNYDYGTYKASLKEIVALCCKCHSFIHGRFRSMSEGLETLRYGLEILNTAGLPLPYLQLRFYRYLGRDEDAYANADINPQPSPQVLTDQRWTLVLGDDE